jgi:hypothetical protein
MQGSIKGNLLVGHAWIEGRSSTKQAKCARLSTIEGNEAQESDMKQLDGWITDTQAYLLGQSLPQKTCLMHWRAPHTSCGATPCSHPRHGQAPPRPEPDMFSTALQRLRACCYDMPAPLLLNKAGLLALPCCKSPSSSKCNYVTNTSKPLLCQSSRNECGLISIIALPSLCLSCTPEPHGKQKHDHVYGIHVSFQL